MLIGSEEKAENIVQPLDYPGWVGVAFPFLALLSPLSSLALVLVLEKY